LKFGGVTWSDLPGRKTEGNARATRGVSGKKAKKKELERNKTGPVSITRRESPDSHLKGGDEGREVFHSRSNTREQTNTWTHKKRTGTNSKQR